MGSGKLDGQLNAATLVTQMRPALVRYFKRKSGDASEAEDLAQDVLTRTLGQALRESAAEARGYIFRIAANRWHDRLRRNVIRAGAVALDDDTGGLPDEDRTPERTVMAEQELGQVIRALLELDAQTRNVFLLVRLEQMKIATVAQMLGISRSAVNRLLAKGLAHVRAQEEA